MPIQSEAEVKAESESKAITNLYEIIRLIDSQVGHDLTRKMYYSEYKIYRTEFTPYLNMNNDVLKYSGNVNDHDNKIFEDIIQYPIIDVTTNKMVTSLIMITDVNGSSVAITKPVLNELIIKDVISKYNVAEVYSKKIYEYLINSVNQDLLKQNSKYQNLANYISNIVTNNLSDIDFAKDLSNNISQILTNNQLFLYAPPNKTILLGHNVKLINNGYLYIAVVPQIVFPYCVDLFIRKKRTNLILKKIFDDLQIKYNGIVDQNNNIDSFYNNYISQKYTYIEDPSKLNNDKSTGQSTDQSTDQSTGQSTDKSKKNNNYLLWGGGVFLCLSILILIIVLIKIL